MIAAIIRASVKARFLVLMATFALVAAGLWAVRNTPVDALPDLSDVQVIIRTSYPGQAPQIVENQVTYPLATTMLSVPGARTVRGYSFFGDSYVYVLFEDGTDLYCPTALDPRSVRTPRVSAGSMNMRSSTARASMTCRSCAACRTGSCAMSSRRFPAWPRSPVSVAWCASIRWCSTPPNWPRLA